MIKIIGTIKYNLLRVISFGRVSIKGLKGYIGTRSKVLVEADSRIAFGYKTWISDFCAIVSTGKGIKIGDNCYFNSNVRIFSMDSIIIGDNCLFGPNIVIVDHNHKHNNPNELICKQGFECSNVEIGSDCWICANVVITPGVKIEDHIVIAANSVVVGHLKEPGTYAGAPAKLIKTRDGE